MKTKQLTAFFVMLVMLITINMPVSAVEENVNLFPAGATERNANWPSVGAGNTFETVTFDGEPISSVTANHTASLGADATVFMRRDMTGGYSMECMQNGEHPLEFNREYEFSTWVKTSSTKLKDLKIKWTYFWDGGAVVEAYPDNVMELEETTDWQKLSTTFKVSSLQNLSGNPVEFNFELLTTSGLTLDAGETFSVTFHDFSLVKLPEKVIVQEPYGNLIIDEFTEGTAGLGQGSNAETAAISLVEDSFDGSGRNSILFTHTASTDNAIGMCHMPGTLTMPTTLTEGKIPLEHGKTYYVSMWIKTTAPTQISSLYPFVRMYHDRAEIDADGYLAWMYQDKKAVLDDTTDWQYISTSFTIDDNVLRQVADAGGVVSHFYFNFLSEAAFEASEDEPVMIAIDRLSLREVPPTDELAVSLVNVSPDETAGLAESDAEVVFEFDNPINRYAVTEESVLINGEAQSSAAIDLTVEERKIVIAPVSLWKNSMEYVVSVDGITDAWGRAINGNAEVSFKVKDFLDTETAFYKVVEDSTESLIDRLTSGEIKAKCTVTSNSSEPQNVIMLLALCSGQTIKKVATSESKTLLSGEDDTFTASIDVPAEDGYYLKIFLWDSLTSHIGLADIIELR